jgi:hypothetical protein
MDAHTINMNSNVFVKCTSLHLAGCKTLQFHHGKLFKYSAQYFDLAIDIVRTLTFFQI